MADGLLEMGKVCGARECNGLHKLMRAYLYMSLGGMINQI